MRGFFQQAEAAAYGMARKQDIMSFETRWLARAGSDAATCRAEALNAECNQQRAAFKEATIRSRH
eukprot:3821286-Pyramimonas_sp.AAC.1